MFTHKISRYFSLCNFLTLGKFSVNQTFSIIVPVLPIPPKRDQNLRTIIVIADVHRRFGDWREPLPLTFRHWSGVSPYTSPYGFAETCVFGKQSLGKL